MSEKKDNTYNLLRLLLSEIYEEQTESQAYIGDSYLIAQDGQFLGRILANRYDNDSILNKYSPYGSKYSPTSIFNKYCQYGGRYGIYSPENRFCYKPPKLFIKGRFKGYVTANQYIPNRIPIEDFLYTLDNNVSSLLSGYIIKAPADSNYSNQ